MVQIKLPAVLRDYAGGSVTVHVEGGTAREVLAALEARHPAIGRRVLDEQGSIRRHVHVYIDDERLRSLDDTIAPTAQVTILPAVSGGS